MRSEVDNRLRAIAAVAAIYIAFLLCAQFGFLAQLELRLGSSSAALRTVLAAMGIGGLGGSAFAVVLGRRVGAARSIRVGLLTVAAATALSSLAAGSAALTVAGAALGSSLGLATVALAGGLGELVPRESWGSVAGWGTGIAYAVSNLPPLFSGPPVVRALVPAALCLASAFVAPESEGGTGRDVAVRLPSWRFAGWVAAFTALVMVDSAAFAHLQATPSLLARTWGGGAHQLRQGAVHLLAAVLAGRLLDRGRLRVAVALAAALFAGALPVLGRADLVAYAAVVYAAGVSLYSAALVAAPAIAGRGRPGAAWLYGIAGWLGSGAGVGAAEQHAFGAVVGIGGVGLLAWAALEGFSRSRSHARLLGAMTAGAALGLLALQAAPSSSGADREPVAAGRQVYLAEGCQHCHSQYVRPLPADEEAWGPFRPFDRRQRPPTPGNRRIGPDLSNAGLRRSALWHELHLRSPRALVPGSRMPSYSHLFAAGDERGPALVAYLATLGGDREAERLLAVREWRPPARLRGDAARGAELFARRCAPCHGATGRGDGAAARSFARSTMDLTKGSYFRVIPSASDEPLEDALARTIRFGLPPGTMPGFEWASDREIADLTAFVLRLSRSTGAEPHR